ncbi:hypothetical protein EYB53_020560 [Candidatus Chloroploca sp. M-50]|uniref:Uncharacterized protein n=1 Tax=Candidatus Chloroploca mongolica TaxID=2528176 RepID=A0ABS4DFA9_9CHLR|nr:hypothetical protein [Candidatus Chloroploca mongolica]MBP1468117.1 hypothetical protein [Candidatus Chloroploca mongolica]
MFIDRVQAFNPAFVPDAHALSSVTAICTRLDGLPLAIELAATQSIIATMSRHSDVSLLMLTHHRKQGGHRAEAGVFVPTLPLGFAGSLFPQRHRQTWCATLRRVDSW